MSVFSVRPIAATAIAMVACCAAGAEEFLVRGEDRTLGFRAADDQGAIVFRACDGTIVDEAGAELQPTDRRCGEAELPVEIRGLVREIAFDRQLIEIRTNAGRLVWLFVPEAASIQGLEAGQAVRAASPVPGVASDVWRISGSAPRELRPLAAPEPPSLDAADDQAYRAVSPSTGYQTR